MPTKSGKKVSSPVSRKELGALVKKYVRAQQSAGKSNLERLNVVRDIMDRAIHVEHAQLHVDIHTAGQKKSRTEHYKLTDPRAAMLLLERFCNIWIPMPVAVCIAKFGCPVVMAPPAGFWIGCVLIGCFVNACPAPGAVNVMCVYLCV